MKKILFCMAACAVLALCMTGCSSQQTFEEGSYSSAGEEVRAVTVDVSDREVLIGASADGQVRIEYSESEKEYYDISLSQEGKLTMTLVLDKQWTDFIGTKPAIEDRTIRLYLPDGLLSSLKVTTTNEEIVLSPLSVSGSVALDSNGGDVRFDSVLVGTEASFAAKNGNIVGSLVGGWDDFSISCTVKKGESNLPESKPGGEKSLAVDCNNGDVAIEFV